MSRIISKEDLYKTDGTGTPPPVVEPAKFFKPPTGASRFKVWAQSIVSTARQAKIKPETTTNSESENKEPQKEDNSDCYYFLALIALLVERLARITVSVMMIKDRLHCPFHDPPTSIIVLASLDILAYFFIMFVSEEEPAHQMEGEADTQNEMNLRKESNESRTISLTDDFTIEVKYQTSIDGKIDISDQVDNIDYKTNDSYRKDIQDEEGKKQAAYITKTGSNLIEFLYWIAFCTILASGIHDWIYLADNEVDASPNDKLISCETYLDKFGKNCSVPIVRDKDILAGTALNSTATTGIKVPNPSYCELPVYVYLQFSRTVFNPMFCIPAVYGLYITAWFLSSVGETVVGCLRSACSREGRRDSDSTQNNDDL